MSDLRWYLPLEQCSTVDGIRSQWQALLERSQMAPWHNIPRYEDAMLSFLGGCALAPHLKLAAVGMRLRIRLRLTARRRAADGTDR